MIGAGGGAKNWLVSMGSLLVSLVCWLVWVGWFTLVDVEIEVDIEVEVEAEIEIRVAFGIKVEIEAG